MQQSQCKFHPLIYGKHLQYNNRFRLLGKECNPSLLTGALQHHGYHGHDEVAAQQSKDAIIYVTVSLQNSFAE